MYIYYRDTYVQLRHRLHISMLNFDETFILLRETKEYILGVGPTKIKFLVI